MMIDSDVLHKRLNDKSLFEWMDNSKDSDSYKRGYLSGLIKAQAILSEVEYFETHGHEREPIVFDFSDEAIKGLELIIGAVSDKLKELELTSHSETEIVNACIGLMSSVFYRMIEYMEDMGFDYKEEERPTIIFNYFEIVQRLLLFGTKHSGGASTIAKCKQLGFDPFAEVIFKEDEEDLTEFD